MLKTWYMYKPLTAPRPRRIVFSPVLSSISCTFHEGSAVSTMTCSCSRFTEKESTPACIEKQREMSRPYCIVMFYALQNLIVHAAIVECYAKYQTQSRTRMFIERCTVACKCCSLSQTVGEMLFILSYLPLHSALVGLH